MADLGKLQKANTERWAKAKITRPASFSPVASRLFAAKARYQTISARTGVPWFVIAVIHEREASQKWTANIAQGDPWNQRSVHVPEGRGPFASFEDAAYDALMNCAPHAGQWKDWSAGGTLTLLEQYNGLGYANGPSPSRGPNAGKHFPPQPSPYIWSGTDQYKSGKFVADHDFRPEVVDSQLGCAGLILALQALDPTIKFGTQALTPLKSGGSAAGGLTAAATANQAGFPWWACALLAVGVAVVIFAIWHFVEKKHPPETTP